MKRIIKRKLLLSEKESKGIIIGYARSIKTEIDELNDQIHALKHH